MWSGLMAGVSVKLLKSEQPSGLPMQQQPALAVDVLCVGHASFDLTLMVTHHPGPDEKCSATGLATCGGGPAANAAVAVARLGGRSAFAGYLGEDHAGSRHFNELQNEGVGLDLVVRGKHPTPVSVILVKPNGNRTVVSARIGTPFLSADQVDFRRCPAQVILFDGHEPLVSTPLAQSARKSGAITVLDAGSVHRGTLELLPLVDYLVASERFARDFSGEENEEKAFKVLKEQAPSVVVTLGERGLRARSCGRDLRLPAFPVTAVDTTGAGDTFHGAFALALAQSSSFLSALIFAGTAAALTCMNIGARPGIPTRQQVQQFLADRGSGPIVTEFGEPAD